LLARDGGQSTSGNGVEDRQGRDCYELLGRRNGPPHGGGPRAAAAPAAFIRWTKRAKISALPAGNPRFGEVCGSFSRTFGRGAIVELERECRRALRGRSIRPAIVEVGSGPGPMPPIQIQYAWHRLSAYRRPHGQRRGRKRFQPCGSKPRGTRTRRALRPRPHSTRRHASEKAFATASSRPTLRSFRVGPRQHARQPVSRECGCFEVDCTWVDGRYWAVETSAGKRRQVVSASCRAGPASVQGFHSRSFFPQVRVLELVLHERKHPDGRTEARETAGIGRLQPAGNALIADDPTSARPTSKPDRQIGRHGAWPHGPAQPSAQSIPHRQAIVAGGRT